MKSTYFSYLNSLNKEELIELIYKPFQKYGDYPAISKRRVALRLSYDGKNYKGVQHHKHLRSVHDCLQNALEITGIGNGIVFCGRTDAGVSAISMIVSADMNSRISSPNREYNIVEEDYTEYPYDVILNMHLPEDVRVTGWAPVPDMFNARYSCIQRWYKYFFVLNDLDLERMYTAVEVIGKMDNFYGLSTHSNPKAIYKRSIDEIKIEKVNMITERRDTKELSMFETGNNEGDLYCLDIKASGFLHNMVRKIFWAVQNYGKCNELMTENVEIADARPLVFVGAKYEEDLNFIGNKYTVQQFKDELDIIRAKSAIAKLKYEMHKMKF